MAAHKKPTRQHAVMRQRSLRLPADMLERLDRRAAEQSQSTNALAARLIDEGLRTERHPLIYFRDGEAGRRPALIGTRLDVWKVIETLRNHDNDVADTGAYLGLPESRVRACIRYYAEFRDEVDAWAQRMDEYARREEEAGQREHEALA